MARILLVLFLVATLGSSCNTSSKLPATNKRWSTMGDDGHNQSFTIGLKYKKTK